MTLSRRTLLKLMGGAAALAASARYGDRHAAFARILERATLTPSTGCSPTTLSQVEHIVMFMHENRSFDQYFGTFHGVEGFGDGRAPVFRQPTPGRPGFVLPYHIDNNVHSQIFDVNHNWDPQHLSWHLGCMDAFASTHLSVEVDGPPGVITMGYYERADLAFYYALADAFTICDHYHCSVIGPTDPNHLYWLSATLDPAGQHGGPLLETCNAPNRFTWPTMPEELEKAGISWKFYGTPNFSPFGFTTDFVRYNAPGPFHDKGVVPSFEDFLTDAATGQLPQVSWVLGSFANSEHPPNPSDDGEMEVATALAALTAIPEKWAQTVLFMTFDENGGYFDHVPPGCPQFDNMNQCVGSDENQQCWDEWFEQCSNNKTYFCTQALFATCCFSC